MMTNIGLWAVACSPRSGHLDPSAVILNVSAGGFLRIPRTSIGAGSFF